LASLVIPLRTRQRVWLNLSLPRQTKTPAAAATGQDSLFSSPAKRNFVLGLLLVVATLVLYNPVNQHPFVNYDDPGYITDNLHVRAGLNWETIRWSMTATEQANWHPLTWISHALDYQFFGLNPAGHHFVNVIIHALCAALLFLVLVYGSGRTGPSLLVAALFAIHPINVESVAWIAERKNVLSTLFFVATLGAYLWYARQPGWRRYLAVTILFALGLMAKPMLVTVPGVLLLLDYWPLARIEGWEAPQAGIRQRRLVELLMEKLPWLGLSIASAVITLIAQQSGGATRSTMQFSLGVRLENAIVACAAYLWKMIWPARLAPMYPHPGDSLPAWQIALAALVLVCITALAVGARRKGYLLVGWLWFLGTLVPVIGLVQVGDQAMADRYAYVPLIGIFIMLAFGLADLAEQARLSLAARAFPVVLVLALLAWATHRQIGYWSSNYDLWAHTLAITRNNFIAEDNMGGALLLLDRPDEAYQHFQAATAINERDPMSHFNAGAYLQQHHQLAAAVEQYENTIRLTSDPPLRASAYANLGSAYRDLGEDAKAQESYEQALQLNPAQFNAYLGLGILREKQGRLDEAIRNYSKSVELRPTEQGYLRLGRSLESMGRRQEALAAYQQALQLNPDSAEAQRAAAALGK